MQKPDVVTLMDHWRLTADTLSPLRIDDNI